jgi:hypothetical protein
MRYSLQACKIPRFAGRAFAELCKTLPLRKGSIRRILSIISPLYTDCTGGHEFIVRAN